jgi:hypothetical protein
VADKPAAQALLDNHAGASAFFKRQGDKRAPSGEEPLFMVKAGHQEPAGIHHAQLEQPGPVLILN